MILLIVPGIIWALKYSQVRFLILDGQMGIMEVFSKSARMTNGSKMELFILYILLGLLNFAGALLFGIGLLFTVPLTMIVVAFVYNLLLKTDITTPVSSPEQNATIPSSSVTV